MPNSKKGTYLTPTDQLHTLAAVTGMVHGDWGGNDYLANHCRNGSERPKRIEKWNSSPLATSCEELTHWKGLWCWEGLGAGGEVDDRGWDAGTPQMATLAAKAILLSTMPVLQPHTLLAGTARHWPPFKHNEKVSIIITPALAFAHSCVITHWLAQSQRVSSKVLDNAPVSRALDHSWSLLWPKCEADPGTETVALLFCKGFNLDRKSVV